MSASDGFAGWSGDVRDEWVDYNRHLTDWAYAVVCAQANEAFLDHLGLGADYRRRTGCTTYTVESQLRYLAEVRTGARLSARTVLVDSDAKRLRMHTTVLDEGGTEVLTGEYLFLHVDQGAGRVSAFPPDRAEIVERVRAAHASWPRPSYLGRGVGAARS